MKEFCILPCHVCKRTPSVNKDTTKEDKNRYIISHCGMESKALTETEAIVNWNKLQLNFVEENNEQRDEERTTP